MQGPEKNSYKEFDNEKKFLPLENSPPPPNNFSNGPSLNLSSALECSRDVWSLIYMKVACKIYGIVQVRDLKESWQVQ